MIVYGGSKGGTRSGDATTDMTDTLWIFDPLQYRGTAKTNGWTAVRLANSTNGGASPAGRMLGPDGSVLAQQSITPMYGHALLVNTDLVIVQGGYRLISAKDLGKNTAVDNTSEYRVRAGRSVGLGAARGCIRTLRLGPSSVRVREVRSLGPPRRWTTGCSTST